MNFLFHSVVATCLCPLHSLGSGPKILLRLNERVAGGGYFTYYIHRGPICISTHPQAGVTRVTPSQCVLCICITVCGSVFLFVETFVSAAVLLVVANPGDADKWQSLCLQLQSLPRPSHLAVPVTAILHVCPIAKCSVSTYVRPYLLTLSCSHPCPQSIQYSSVDNDINYIGTRVRSIVAVLCNKMYTITFANRS